MCKFSFLLRLLDIYPLQVPVKGSFVDWCPENIYITTPYNVEETFSLQSEHLKQLTRRIFQVREFRGSQLPVDAYAALPVQETQVDEEDWVNQLFIN